MSPKDFRLIDKIEAGSDRSMTGSRPQQDMNKARLGFASGRNTPSDRPPRLEHTHLDLTTRHCERSEAIQGNGGRLATLDRRVASLLAMTIPFERSALLGKAFNVLPGAPFGRPRPTASARQCSPAT